MANQPEQTIDNYRALLALAVETDNFLIYLAAAACAYNLRLMGELDDDY